MATRRGGRIVTESKVGDKAYLHFRGIEGAFAVPQAEQDVLNGLEDEALFARVDVGGFIDPFALAEVLNRNLYGAYQTWKNPNRSQGAAFAGLLDKLIGG